jgi:uncharacterized protein (DUF1778 family)
MKNKLKSVRSNSKSAASPQSETAQRKVKVRRETGLPLVALFPEGEQGSLDKQELVDLTRAEYAMLQRAAAPTGDGIIMFMVNAALEKMAPLGETVTCVFTLPDGSEVARVDFPREVFSRIERAAAKRGITLEQFFINAIRHYIAKYANRRAA